MSGRGSIKRRGQSWRARFRNESGKDVQRSFATRGQAQSWLTEQLASIQRGTYVSPSAGAITFGEYAKQWLSQQHVRPRTASLQEGRVRLYLAPVLGELALSSLRRSHVVEVIQQMAARGLSPMVIRYTITTLRTILESAVRDRLIVANVAADRTIAMPKRTHEPMVMLSSDQVAAIAAAMEPRYRAMVIVAAATGLRSGELRALTADRITPAVHLAAIDVPPRQVTLRIDRQITAARVFGPVKTASSNREVTVGANVVATLTAHVRQFGLGVDGLIFSSPTGRVIPAARASEIWTRAVDGLDLPAGATWHALRHSHASELLSQGINPAAVAKRLGHASPAITMGIYAHCLPSDEERILSAAEGIAMRIAGMA